MTLTASAPASQPTWNSGGANRTTPTGPKQALGWVSGESPSSAFFNWWQNLVLQWTTYLNTSVNDLESSKINKTGAADLSGNFTPTAAAGASFGSSLRPLGAVVTNQIDLRTDGVQSNFNPFLTSTYTLGTAGKRWLSAAIASLVSDTISVGDLDASGIVCDVINPLDSGNGTVGQNGSAYGAVVAHTMRARSFRVTKVQATQATDASLCELVQNNCIVAAVAITFSGGPINKTGLASFNFAAINRYPSGSALGDYQIQFQRPVHIGSAAMVTVNGAGSHCCSAVFDAGGGSIRVRIRTVSSSPSNVDEEFSLVIVGLPFNTVADVIA